MIKKNKQLFIAFSLIFIIGILGYYGFLQNIQGNNMLVEKRAVGTGNDQIHQNSGSFAITWSNNPVALSTTYYGSIDVDSEDGYYKYKTTTGCQGLRLANSYTNSEALLLSSQIERIYESSSCIHNNFNIAEITMRKNGTLNIQYSVSETGTEINPEAQISIRINGASKVNKFSQDDQTLTETTFSEEVKEGDKVSISLITSINDGYSFGSAKSTAKVTLSAPTTTETPTTQETTQNTQTNIETPQIPSLESPQSKILWFGWVFMAVIIGLIIYIAYIGLIIYIAHRLVNRR